MYRKGLGPSNLPGLDENPDYTCPELPVYVVNTHTIQHQVFHY